MTHLWVRAEQRPNEERVGITPDGVRQLVEKGIKVTVEKSSVRAIPDAAYEGTGCAFAEENSWPDAPLDAIIFGLKELPEDGTPLPHKHIMFGHAFKGQHSGIALLKRFKAGGGTLYDLEYLVDETGRRVAALLLPSPSALGSNCRSRTSCRRGRIPRSSSCRRRPSSFHRTDRRTGTPPGP